MSPENTGSNKNQKPKLTKKIILLVPVILAIASATLYRESKSNLPSSTNSASTTHSEAGTKVLHSFMQGEPFTQADGVNFIPPVAAPIKKEPTSVDGPARVHDHLAAERQFMLERFDHSVVNQHSTSHNSDLPGVSIAAY